MQRLNDILHSCLFSLTFYFLPSPFGRLLSLTVSLPIWLFFHTIFFKSWERNEPHHHRQQQRRQPATERATKRHTIRLERKQPTDEQEEEQKKKEAKKNIIKKKRKQLGEVGFGLVCLGALSLYYFALDSPVS